MSANQLVAPYSKRLIEPYFDFHPDLIIEAINACNRACQGCYAANTLVNKNKAQTSAKFINLDSLTMALSEIPHVEIVTIRGGEPSIHPYIDQVLEVVRRKSNFVILETHGRWINSNAPLLNVCKNLDIKIKVSFDSMHGLSADQLRDFHKILSNNSIEYFVAITEPTYEEFIATRSLCHWIPNSKIIFQKKAVTLDELIVPKIGVIKVGGELNKTLSVKNDFLSGRRHAY